MYLLCTGTFPLRARVKEVEAVAARNTNEITRVDNNVEKLRRELEIEKGKNKEAAERMDDRYITREELRERENKKTNVILHRVIEPGVEIRTAEERTTKDLEECGKIFKELDMEREAAEDINVCRRIGERGEEPRPMVVVLRTEEAKRKLLDRAKKLRNTAYEEVGIVPDMTVQQRKEENSMIAEVERMNEEELTDEDRAKNLRWLVVGPRGEKKIIKGIPREQQYGRGAPRGRGFVPRVRSRGGPAGRWNTARGRTAGGLTQELLPSTEPATNRTRLASKRTRGDLEENGPQETEEEEEYVTGEEEEGQSPARKK